MSNIQYPDLALRIDGKKVKGTGNNTELVYNPANEAVLGELIHASESDIEEALSGLQEGFEQWRHTSPQTRGAVLQKTALLMRERIETISHIATLESGKPISQTRVEVETAADLFDWFAEEGKRAYGRLLPQRSPEMQLSVRKEPVGPVAAFSPWNFPVVNPARKLSASLAAGCPAIIKPAEETPASALCIADILYEAGLPGKTLAVVFGEPPMVSSHILASPVIRKMTFTGSTAVGKHLMSLASANMIRTTMELGGHAPVIIAEDADIERAVALSVAAKFRGGGQVCISPTRFYIHQSVYERFVERFVAQVEKLQIGDGLSTSTELGPMIHEKRCKALLALVQDATAKGAILATGGSTRPGKGYFFEPTVLLNAPEGARVMNEEPFGPVAILNAYDSDARVLREANRLPYGLAAYIFSNSAKTTHYFKNNIEAGMIGVNTFAISWSETPFGGIKQSGHGSEQSIEGLDAFLHTRFISEDYS